VGRASQKAKRKSQKAKVKSEGQIKEQKLRSQGRTHAVSGFVLLPFALFGCLALTFTFCLVLRPYFCLLPFDLFFALTFAF
jgi:hypothetical protein